MAATGGDKQAINVHIVLLTPLKYAVSQVVGFAKVKSAIH